MSPAATKIGKFIARKLFQERGNHSEVHLTEEQLAQLIAAGAEGMFKIMTEKGK